MQRRTALKNLALTAGLLHGIPTWASAWNGTFLRAPRRFLSFDQQTTLTEALETLLPATDTPGAKDLGLPAFVQKMLKDCYEPTVQETVKNGLDSLDALAMTTYQQSFAAADTVRRQDLLKRLELSTDTKQKEAYALMKSLAILGFTTSEYVMTKHLNYTPIPGHYYGCMPVQAN